MMAPPKKLNPRKRSRGLTLMETSLATVIVGLAVLSITKLVSATTTQTGYSQKLTVGFMLANNIREMLATRDFASTQLMNGFNATPPVDANNQPIANSTNWRQDVSVQLIGDSAGASLYGVINNGSAIVERVRVTISYSSTSNGPWDPVITLSWLKTAY